MSKTLSPEGFFLLYAFPAINHCSPNLAAGELSLLETMAIHGEQPSLERLQKIFPRAFQRIAKFTGKTSKYSLQDFKTYWWTEHNRIIEKREGGYELATLEEAELCKVSFPIVKQAQGKIVTVSYPQGVEKKGINYRNLPLLSGQRVSMHKGHIIEIVPEGIYSAYFSHAH